ncbi:hypothetical protein P153DRAFT_367442 [Dothidotthia symphoricarpi CBS 119687]|uniref:Uncharacterized protein n=1 Tax=Dothidotthia symphoricarpi CBS 119687 TaxID=1392245 RepID=A0A6A6AAU3_9PLEO|nr:uncharacterized protein P153DRAFT_367442 [Dothidotthia symphoricarpi CBS 119687]KAF2128265.1 hypothetical protein P153DRAFT_367442 [Dothidotthia symphoricarpi CBS 119687]
MVVLPSSALTPLACASFGASPTNAYVNTKTNSRASVYPLTLRLTISIATPKLHLNTHFLTTTTTTTMSSSALNYPLLAIPAYYAFSILPHIYAGTILSSAGYKPNNANPKASLSPDAVKGKVPDAVFQKYQRAENAQSNNAEQMPLFAVAVLASIMAERATATGLGHAVAGKDITGLSTFVGAWFVVRAAYCVAYVQIADHSTSFVRSGAYAVGTGLAFYQIYKAASVLG